MQPKSHKKACFLAKTGFFVRYFGGDKRDQTADLLNAMASGGGQNEFHWINWSK